MKPASIPLVALLAVGCGDSWSSNPVSLAPVEGAPVTVDGVVMRHSLMVGLGSAPTRVSSGDAPNTIGVSFSIEKTAETPPHAGASARIACRVGDHVVVEPMAHDASDRLAGLAVGARISSDATLSPSPFTAEIPTTCEVAFLYMVRPPIEVPPIGSAEPDPAAPGPEAADLALGSVCLVGGTLREGACTPEELPRIPARSAIEVSELSARIASHPSGGYGVQATALLTAGRDAPRRWQVGATARCDTDGGSEERPLSMLAVGRDVAPGESIVASGATSPREAWPEEPRACTLRLERSGAGGRAPIGEYCVRGDETTAGACGDAVAAPPSSA